MVKVKRKNVDDVIIYPELEAKFRCGDTAIGADEMKKILNWETEEEYKIRMLAENPKAKESKLRYGDNFLLKDFNGDKVQCWNNSRNRRFRLDDCKAYAQDILNRQWAGPTTMPGETVNGEPMIISRTGEVLSGQHTGVALILAKQMWDGNTEGTYRDLWPTEPVLDRLVVRGVSDNPKVLRTLNNVIPQTDEDNIYTSEIFAKMDHQGKKECSRMLAKAVDLLWRRTQASSIQTLGTETERYRTRSTTQEFIERHKRLKECVKHLFDLNKDRSISGLDLSPGQCAGFMYLMGSSSSEIDTYRNATPPSEKKLNFEHLEKAGDYFTELAKGGANVLAVAAALRGLVDPETAIGAREVEKHAVIIKGWLQYKERGEVEFSGGKDNILEYKEVKGKMVLAEFPDCGGIDLGPTKVTVSEEEERTPEQVEADKQFAKEERMRIIQERVAERRKAKADKEAGFVVGKAPKVEGRTKGITVFKTRKQIQAEQTRKAREADEAKMQEGEVVEAEPVDEDYSIEA